MKRDKLIKAEAVGFASLFLMCFAGCASSGGKLNDGQLPTCESAADIVVLEPVSAQFLAGIVDTEAKEKADSSFTRCFQMAEFTAP